MTQSSPDIEYASNPLRDALLRGFLSTSTSEGEHHIKISFETLEQMQDARKALYHAIRQRPNSPDAAAGAPNSPERKAWIDYVVTLWNEADLPIERRLEEALQALSYARFPDAATTAAMGVSLAPHELEAMRELVLYLPAIARSLEMPKLINWSQMIEDVIERIEAAEK